MGELSKGLDGNADVFVIPDIFFGLRVACPLPDNIVGSTTTMAIRTFAGKRVIHKLHADRSGGIHKALKKLSIMPQCSQPGVPQTNAFVERANAEVLNGARVLFLVAGLPHCFGEYATKSFCFLDNVTRLDAEGVTPWRRTHGMDFNGNVSPFGSKVYFRTTTEISHKIQFEDQCAQVSSHVMCPRLDTGGRGYT